MKFLRDSSFLYFGFIVKILLTLLIDRLLAINLGPEYYGVYKYSITILIILGTISGFGFSSSIVRTLAINSSFNYIKKILSVSFILQTFIALGLILMVVKVNIAEFLGAKDLSIFILFSLLGFVFNQFIIGIYSAFKKTKSKVIINEIIHPVLYLLLLIFCKHFLGLDIKSIYILYFINTYLVFLINLINLINYLNHRKKLNFNEKKTTQKDYIEFLKYSFPIYLTALLILISGAMDKLVLVHIVSERVLGVYYAMFTLSSILNLMLTSLLFLFLPIASSYFGNGRKRLGGYFCSFSSKWLMFVVFIPFWLLFFYSRSVIQLFYHSTYLEGELVLKILSVAGFVNVSAGFTGQTLLALGDSFRQMIIRILGLTLGILLMYILGLNFAEVGIAISILISLIFTNFLQIGIIKRKHNVNLYNKGNLNAVIYILSFIFMRLMINYIYQVPFWIGITLDTIIYFAIGIKIKIVGKQDLRFIKLINS